MKYSVTIPAYKSKFLKECIDSILAQTFEDFEIVIVNDASPEDLDSIVNQYTDPRIRYYVNEKNCGAIDVVDNWNKCLQYAQGDYIICMGDDDMLAPNCLEEYNTLMEKYPNLDVYHTRTMMVDENSQFCDLQEERPEYESVYSMIWHRFMKARIQFIGDYLFKTSALRDAGGFYKLPLAWESDCVTSYIAANNKGIANTSTPIFYYRQNRSSITNSQNVRIKMDATLQFEQWLHNFLEYQPKDNFDNKYWTLIKRDVGGRIKHNKIYMIGDDIKCSHLSSIIYWLNNRKRLGLSVPELLFSVGIGVTLMFKRN
ncbi:MAG: glycosyltransferase [Bacteroidaceae bacterium]|nr:glycosyltransferase [Bacteroidaceae bacterium]